MENIFSRTLSLLGPTNMAQLRQSKVAVFGIGGVGSFVTEALARTGLGQLTLIDGDLITPSNINRQIHATHQTIGLSKVLAMKERILAINPQAEVITHQVFYCGDQTQHLLKDDYDYVVDAIDMIRAKVDLIVHSQAMGLRIISAMGAGNKLDPTKFQIADLFSTSVCPLARIMRKELRSHGIKQLKVVYSQERPLKPLNTTNNQQMPGSISFVPSVAGLIIASEVIKDLLSKEVQSSENNFRS